MALPLNSRNRISCAFHVLFCAACVLVPIYLMSQNAVRKKIQTADGQTLEGRVLNEGMSDLQILTDDQRVHLLRKTGEDRYRAVTSQRDWPAYHGDPSG